MTGNAATNVARALARLKEYWSPRVIGRVNDQYVKVAKLKGQLAWHQHELEDELFLVVYGQLKLQLEHTRMWSSMPVTFMSFPKAPCTIQLLKTSVA